MDAVLFFFYERLLFVPFCQFRHLRDDVFNVFFSVLFPRLQVRDTFLKLLRPGVDFRQTFMDYVEKHIFARRINRFKDEKEYYRLREDAQVRFTPQILILRYVCIMPRMTGLVNFRLPDSISYLYRIYCSLYLFALLLLGGIGRGDGINAQRMAL